MRTKIVIKIPEHFTICDNMIDPPEPESTAASVTVERGPNIQPIPKGQPPQKNLDAEIILKVGDNITTDHIMPAGTKVLPYRSNIPKLSEFCFTVCDPNFPNRAKSRGGGIILGGNNYGQGSSREHAAMVPRYLGVKAVIAKSFARIHVANLINFGIVPFTFKNEADYDTVDQGDTVRIETLINAIEGSSEAIMINVTKGISVPLNLSLTERQRQILLCGGMLEYTKKNV